MFIIKYCWWLDSNCRPLELEATTLPTVPQPLPFHMFCFFVSWAISRSLSTAPHPIQGQGSSILLVLYSMIILKPAIFDLNGSCEVRSHTSGTCRGIRDTIPNNGARTHDQFFLRFALCSPNLGSNVTLYCRRIIICQIENKVLNLPWAWLLPVMVKILYDGDLHAVDGGKG